MGAERNKVRKNNLLPQFGGGDLGGGHSGALE
jgi:hypothetical protein